MSTPRAIVHGVRRAFSARGLIFGLWLVNLVVALAATWSIGASLHASFGGSVVEEKLRAGFDMGWFGEFQASARGLETTFTPTVVGAGAFFNNLEAWLSGELFTSFPGLVGLGVLYLLVWAFLLGGILQRLAENGRLPPWQVVATGGRYFLRFARLSLLSGACYALVYLGGRWLFIAIERVTGDVIVERTVFAATVAGAALVALLLCVVNMVFDYAKIAIVLEDRPRVGRAALDGLRFVRQHPIQTLSLYLFLVLVGAGLLAAYRSLAPGAGQATLAGVVLAFLGAQLFLVAKLILRLAFYGGQMALYQARPIPR
jgi:hypothetical protein